MSCSSIEPKFGSCSAGDILGPCPVAAAPSSRAGVVRAGGGRWLEPERRRRHGGDADNADNNGNDDGGQ